MTKTKLQRYHYKKTSLDPEKVRQAIIEVYGDDLYSDEEEDIDDDKIQSTIEPLISDMSASTETTAH